MTVSHSGLGYYRKSTKKQTNVNASTAGLGNARFFLLDSKLSATLTIIVSSSNPFHINYNAPTIQYNHNHNKFSHLLAGQTFADWRNTDVIYDFNINAVSSLLLGLLFFHLQGGANTRWETCEESSIDEDDRWRSLVSNVQSIFTNTIHTKQWIINSYVVRSSFNLSVKSMLIFVPKGWVTNQENVKYDAACPYVDGLAVRFLLQYFRAEVAGRSGKTLFTEYDLVSFFRNVQRVRYCAFIRSSLYNSFVSPSSQLWSCIRYYKRTKSIPEFPTFFRNNQFYPFHVIFYFPYTIKVSK